jgi:UDP-N-acetyl-D-mannosaminuronic acid dehydrogenase
VPIDTEQKVTVLGLGYIGLPTAALIARTGCKVSASTSASRSSTRSIRARCISRKSISTASSQGVVVARQSARLAAVAPADVFVIAVPTPLDEDHRARYQLCPQGRDAPSRRSSKARRRRHPRIDLARRHDRKGRELLASCAPISKSPALTGSADIAIAYCPERVLPGRILVELIDNDRCIGGITPRCARKALPSIAVRARRLRHHHGAAAEMTKLVENSYSATSTSPSPTNCR